MYQEYKYASSNPDPNIWYSDSCASYHIIPYKELIHDYKGASISKIKTGYSVIEVEGEGKVTFYLSRNGERVQVTFNNILQVPNSSANLISFLYLNKTFGMVSTFTGERCFVSKNNHLVDSGTGVKDNFYSLDLCNGMALITTQNISNELLH